ncbi:AI-2E family transporter [Wielerella bovis]|uniref:AI-2E family transporter n=1 Tax=Wielerella bovis TaxID=2917790 RepID=UPI002019E1D1|nr:AI-2E family transporter [Wielerella bovis]ULJ64939.1 AI-2E family transporter [Wielerella bovis]ULJ67213.1 AI-2E family transporter [Wielerella bovis]
MYQPNKKRLWLPWLAGFLLITFLVLFFRYLGGILTPFIIAAVLAYILNPLVCKLEARHIKRGRASMWVMLLALFVIVSLLLVIVPMLIGQFQIIVRRIPELVDYTQTHALPWFNAKFGEYITLNSETVITWLRNNAQSIQQSLQKAMPILMQQSGAVAAGISNIILLPLLLYYFLLDWSRWEEGIRTLVPRRYLATYTRVTTEMDTVLGEFLRGQLLVMMIMGIFYGTGLMFIGLESGFAIGMVAGILVFIPYLGAFTGLLLATLAAILQFGSWGGLLAVWTVFLIGQLLESFLITPKIVGDRIGLSPFWVIFALMAFGQLLGFVGMLVALPLAAICLVLIHEGKNVYLNSKFYHREK